MTNGTNFLSGDDFKRIREIILLKQTMSEAHQDYGKQRYEKMQ